MVNGLECAADARLSELRACTRGATAISYVMVLGLVALVGGVAFSQFNQAVRAGVANEARVASEAAGEDTDAPTGSLAAEVVGAGAEQLAVQGAWALAAKAGKKGTAAARRKNRGRGAVAFNDKRGAARDDDDSQTPRDPNATKDTPTKDTPTKDTPTKDTPTKDTPTKDTPTKDTPTKNTSKDTLPKDTPPKGGPVCTGRGCTNGPSCFVAGTPVATPTGPRAIERIAPGDLVVSRDDLTGEISAQRVTATFFTPDMPLVDVETVTPDGPVAPIYATPGHMFFTADRGWLRADALTEGERLVDAHGGGVYVSSVVPVEGRDDVFNFEVEGTHTYFVGGASVLVHNPTDLPGTSSGATDGPKIGDSIDYEIDGDSVSGIITGFDAKGRPIAYQTHFDGKPLDPDDVAFNKEYPASVFGEYKHGAAAGAPKEVRTLEGPVVIRHYYRPDSEQKSSEHIVPGGKIVVTNHGLGAGVYGVIPNADVEPHPGSKHVDVTLNNPYFIQDQQHGSAYTSMSKELQRLADSIKDDPNIAGNPNPTAEDVQKALDENRDQTSSVLDKMNGTFTRTEPGRTTSNDAAVLNDSLAKFFRDYNDKTPGKTAKQPVNYMMDDVLKHDGLYSDNPVDNKFNRGSVLYRVPDDVTKTTHESRSCL